MSARSGAVILETARIRGYARVKAEGTVARNIHTHVFGKVVDYLAGSSCTSVEERHFRVILV